MSPIRIKILLLLLAGIVGRLPAQPAPDGGLPRRARLDATVQYAAGPVIGGRVTHLAAGGTAEKLGLQAGDIIMAIDGQALDRAGAAAARVRLLPAGRELQLAVRRGGGQILLQGILPEVPRETYEQADVTYDSVMNAQGEKLRTIITRPKAGRGRRPAVFVVGWLSDDSVEAAAQNTDTISRLFRSLAEKSGSVLVRLDKPGVGDSDGICAETDFESELSGYQAAFRSLAKYDFIDPGRVFVLGLSNGGGFAPLVAAGAPVRGYITAGGWVKTWFEHMLEIERRRHTLGGEAPAQVSSAMKATAELYHDYLIAGRIPAEIFRGKPALAALWEGDDHSTQYGRPPAFYQQLQKLNLAEAWGRVSVPTLAIHGQYDWIMSREDPEIIAALVNRNRPGAGRFVELPGTGHTLDHYASPADAFRWQAGPPEDSTVRLILAWLEENK